MTFFLCVSKACRSFSRKSGPSLLIQSSLVQKQEPQSEKEIKEEVEEEGKKRITLKQETIHFTLDGRDYGGASREYFHDYEKMIYDIGRKKKGERILLQFEKNYPNVQKAAEMFIRAQGEKCTIIVSDRMRAKEMRISLQGKWKGMQIGDVEETEKRDVIICGIKDWEKIPRDYSVCILDGLRCQMEMREEGLEKVLKQKLVKLLVVEQPDESVGKWKGLLLGKEGLQIAVNYRVRRLEKKPRHIAIALPKKESLGKIVSECLELYPYEKAMIIVDSEEDLQDIRQHVQTEKELLLMKKSEIKEMHTQNIPFSPLVIHCSLPHTITEYITQMHATLGIQYSGVNLLLFPIEYLRILYDLQGELRKNEFVYFYFFIVEQPILLQKLPKRSMLTGHSNRVTLIVQCFHSSYLPTVKSLFSPMDTLITLKDSPTLLLDLSYDFFMQNSQLGHWMKTGTVNGMASIKEVHYQEPWGNIADILHAKGFRLNDELPNGYYFGHGIHYARCFDRRTPEGDAWYYQ